MKRSEINKALKELEAMCREYRFALPPFCHFTPEQWQGLGHEYDEVRECMLGWGIADYGKRPYGVSPLRRGPTTSPPRSTVARGPSQLSAQDA